MAYHNYTINPLPPVFFTLTTLMLMVPTAHAANLTNSSPLSTATSLAYHIGSVVVLFLAVGLAVYYRQRMTSERSSTITALLNLSKDQPDKIENSKRSSDNLVSSALQSVAEHIAELRSDMEKLRGQVTMASTDADLAKAQISDARKQAEASREQGLLSAARTLEVSVKGIDSATERLQIAAASAERGASKQRLCTTEAASAMDEMNSSVAEAAQGAAEAFNDAEAARDRAKLGSEEVARTVQSIHSVSEKTNSLAKTVVALGDQANAIGAIMGVISDIADQTNLLALNAAIEAARAGEAGRGFAVVADEVRKLAEKTMSATGDVRHEIETIQSGVAQARQGMDETGELVTVAVDQATESGQALEEIVTMAQATSERIHSIAAAAQQQSIASEEITRTIAEVDAISRQTGEDMKASEQAVADLAARVQELATMNQVFRLVGEGTVKQVIEELATSADILSMTRHRQEAALEQSINRNNFLELLYITDAKGTQTVRNVARPEVASPADAQACGTNWSSRPWFKEAMEMGTLYVSDVYVSQASGENCITVSSPFRDKTGNILGVIAADVKLSI